MTFRMMPMARSMTANSAEEWGRLMGAAQAGDGAAYAHLLREILPYIRAIVRRHHAAPDRQEDVVQDVLLTIHRVRHTYDPARPVHGLAGGDRPSPVDRRAAAESAD